MKSKHSRLPIHMRGDAGFTLVEILLALMLFGLLAVALFGSIRTNAAAWIYANSHADQSEQSIRAQDVLRYLIENAYPLLLPGDPASRHVAFDGTESSLSFLSAAPMALAKGGRSRISIAVERRNDHVDLMLGSQPELGTVSDRTDRTQKALLTGATSIAFSYFGKTRSQRSADWHHDWSAQTEFPRLLRVAIHFQAGDGRDWPELVLAPRIRADVGCILDPLMTRCAGR